MCSAESQCDDTKPLGMKKVQRVKRNTDVFLYFLQCNKNADKPFNIVEQNITQYSIITNLASYTASYVVKVA